MSRRHNKPDALASTGSSRRDRDTLSHFTRLCTKVPLLQSNAPAKEQLTQIVFGSLAELRATEDRSAELCTGSLSTAGCALCSWKQKAFCEACGTDFAKTQNRAGYPLFIPMFDGGLLHIDVCMLCSNPCVEKLMASKEQMQAEKEAAKAAAKAGSAKGAAAASGSAAAAAAAGSGSSVRVSRIASDPHHSTFSLLFHAGSYAVLLCTLFLADLSVGDLLRTPIGWQLLLCMLLFGLWILNLMLTCTARGEVASVYRLRQALSAVASVVSVACAGTLTLYAAAALLGPTATTAVPAAAVSSSHGLLLELMLLVVPSLLCAVELISFPHIKMPRWLERALCVLLPSLLLAICLNQQQNDNPAESAGSIPLSASSSLADPLFGLRLRTSSPAALGSFAATAIAALFGLSLALERARDRLWRNYVVPKHLQLH